MRDRFSGTKSVRAKDQIQQIITSKTLPTNHVPKTPGATKFDEATGHRKQSARKARTLVGPADHSLNVIKKIYTDSVNGRTKDEPTPLIVSEKRERFDDRIGNFV